MIRRINLRILNFIFFFIAALLLLLSTETYLSIRSIGKISEDIFQHTSHRNMLVQSFNTFKDIESSTRGVVFLGDPLFSEYRESAMERLPLLMSDLEYQIAGNKIQEYYLDQLKKLYNRRIDQLNTLIANDDPVLRNKVLSHSAAVIDQCRILVDKMLLQEEQKLAEANNTLKKHLNTAPFSVLVFVIFLIISLMTGYFSLLSQYRTSKKLQSNLEESNASLEIANREMAVTQTFLKSILDTNPNGTLVYQAQRDEHGKIIDFVITFASGNLKVLGGKNPETLIGKRASDVYPGLKGMDLYTSFIEVTESGVSKKMDIFYPYDGNISGWFEVFLGKFSDGFVLIGRDITEMKEVETELKRQNELLNATINELHSANEQLRRFAFIASHDLQEPLRKIQLFSNKLLDKIRLDNTLNEDADKIRESASKMSELIAAITKYSTLQTNDLQLQLVDLNQVGQQVISDLKTTIREKQASVMIDKLPTIIADPVQISQLFLHLISNAIKFSNRPPVVRVSYTAVDDRNVLESLNPAFNYYRIRFTDNGIGFDNEYSDKLFLIFQRLHNTVAYPGTGVGLAICQKIVENHKGKISAYSNENEGSVFDVYLPANLSLN